MSLRAYIKTIKEEKVIDGKIIKTVEQDLKPLFNVYENIEILRIFERYGIVISTQNHDICMLEITQENWDEYKEDIKIGDFDKPENGVEILQKIDAHLEHNEYLVCTCY